MPAYIIADIQVTDAAAYEPYRPLAAASIARFGGRFVVRGGKVDLLEGEPRAGTDRRHRVSGRRYRPPLVPLGGISEAR